MIHIIIIIACAICGFLLGKAVQRSILQKCSFYKDLARYADLFKINVAGKQIELAQFNANFSDGCTQPFARYLLDGKFPVGISASEKRDVNSFFEGIAKYGSAELVKHIDYYCGVFDKYFKSATETEFRRAAIYPKLGILGGVMLGILFI